MHPVTGTLYGDGRIPCTVFQTHTVSITRPMTRDNTDRDESDTQNPEQRSGLEDTTGHTDRSETVRGRDDPARNADDKRSPVTGKQPRNSPINREVRHDSDLDADPSLAGEERDATAEARKQTSPDTTSQKEETTEEDGTTQD